MITAIQLIIAAGIVGLLCAVAAVQNADTLEELDEYEKEFPESDHGC